MISFFEETSQIFGRSVAEGIEFVRDRLADSLQLPGPEATARTLFVEAPKLFALVRLDSIDSPGKGSAHPSWFCSKRFSHSGVLL